MQAVPSAWENCVLVTLEELIAKPLCSPSPSPGCFCSIVQGRGDQRWKRAFHSKLLGVSAGDPWKWALCRGGELAFAVVHRVVSVCSVRIQEASGLQKGRGKEEAPHKETSQRVHVVYEGNESEGRRRVHVERERGHQPDPGAKGRWLPHWGKRGEGTRT